MNYINRLSSHISLGLIRLVFCLSSGGKHSAFLHFVAWVRFVWLSRLHSQNHRPLPLGLVTSRLLNVREILIVISCVLEPKVISSHTSNVFQSKMIFPEQADAKREKKVLSYSSNIKIFTKMLLTLHSFFLKKIYLYFMYMSVCLCICLCTTYVLEVCRGQKSVSEPLELELEMVASHHVGARKRTWVLLLLTTQPSLQPNFPIPKGD